MRYIKPLYIANDLDNPKRPLINIARTVMCVVYCK